MMVEVYTILQEQKAFSPKKRLTAREITRLLVCKKVVNKDVSVAVPFITGDLAQLYKKKIVDRLWTKRPLQRGTVYAYWIVEKDWLNDGSWIKC